MKEISRAELKQKYETEPLRDVLEYFGFRHSQQLYRLLDKAGIPRKRDESTRIPVKLVD